METKPCVAIVDDDPSARTALVRLLRPAGYRVVVFASGNDFLESLTVYLPDCALVDLAMPGLSGLDVVSRLMTDRLNVPAIIIAAGEDLELAGRAIRAGARALLKKPFSDKQLFAVINSALAVPNSATPSLAVGNLPNDSEHHEEAAHMAMRPTARPFQIEFEGRMYAATYLVKAGAVTVTWYTKSGLGRTAAKQTDGDGSHEAQILLREILWGAKLRREL